MSSNRIVVPGFVEPTRVYRLAFDKRGEPKLTKVFEQVVTLDKLRKELSPHILTLIDTGYPQIRDDLKQHGYWVGDVVV